MKITISWQLLLSNFFQWHYHLSHSSFDGLSTSDILKIEKRKLINLHF